MSKFAWILTMVGVEISESLTCRLGQLEVTSGGLQSNFLLKAGLQ